MRFSHHKARKSCMRQWAKRKKKTFEKSAAAVEEFWLTQKSGRKKWIELSVL